MKISTKIIIGLVVFTVGGFFLGKYVIEHRVGFGAIDYVNTNIPRGFVYTEQGEIPEDLLVSSDYTDIQQVGGMFSQEFYCAKLQKDAEIIVYWKHTEGYGISGGWSYRFAAVCDKDYLIVYDADHLGEAIYGPFSIKE